MTSFLICCSQLNNQLETALREEKQILESLLKWFEKEVHEMEEISVEQLTPDWEIPVADKTITDNITKLLNRIQRLEELKGRHKIIPYFCEDDTAKLQKIQQEFRKLAEEKQIMEDELQKMKGSEVQQEKLGSDVRKRTLPKIEKAKVEEKPSVPERTPTAKQKEHQKMKEDLAKAQANIQSLEKEKKMLEEKLQKVLEEAQIAKGQLAEIPPHIPDWQFPYTTVVEDDKDIPKKGKKSMKSKTKGEDRTDLKQTSATATDRAVSKLQKAETGKAGEIVPGKSQDLSETKDVKLKGRGTAHPDTDRRLSGVQQKESVSLVEKLTDKKEESKKIKAKIEGKSETVSNDYFIFKMQGFFSAESFTYGT
ncbi:hypothetical protein JD844_003410 [Phrynosoma platyrhinos]|uniref:Uncharacterized protein n=1 Tax=Phrynosoma platyrhinos TaxID=52577 RepID=A0ABQ7TDG6_PHRPL|nr:hypothetical protein JD844_003410 [Phrynosoma platyrhinos]